MPAGLERGGQPAVADQHRTAWVGEGHRPTVPARRTVRSGLRDYGGPGTTGWTSTSTTGTPCPVATGTGSTTVGCSATSARGRAGCARASAGCASSAAGSTTRSCSPRYGRSSGFCVDPIEKKPLNHFLPGSAVLSFGTAGCNLACQFCQNWDISKSREIDRLADAAGPADIAEAAVRLGCRSVALTYNDPVIFLEYAVDVADACRARGIKAIAVTAGYIGDEPRRELFAHIDAANVDLKAFTEDFYHRVSAGHLQPVLDTLRLPAARDRRLVRDHHAADPRATTTPTTRSTPSARGSPTTSAATSRCTSPRSTPTSRCATCRRTPPATLRRARAHRAAARAALRLHRQRARRRGRTDHLPRLRRRRWSSGTGTSSAATSSPTTAAAVGCGTAIPGRYDGPVGRWGARRLPGVDCRGRRELMHDASARPPSPAGSTRPTRRSWPTSVDALLAAARPSGRRPVALIAPHAGYRYSGAVAAAAYAQLAGCRATVTRVVVLGPAHFVPLTGMAVPSVDAFATPLGPVPVDARCPSGRARAARRGDRRPPARGGARPRDAAAVPAPERSARTCRCCPCSSAAPNPRPSPDCCRRC